MYSLLKVFLVLMKLFRIFVY